MRMPRVVPGVHLLHLGFPIANDSRSLKKTGMLFVLIPFVPSFQL